MRLVTQRTAVTCSLTLELYSSCKNFLSYVDQHNALSIRILQASLLVAFFEISNAIYPAAYMTVGHCARLGHAMGLHNQRLQQQMLTGPGSSETPIYLDGKNT